MRINFNEVSFTYNPKIDYVLKDVDLELSNNQIIFIMGESGSGKSTLIQHINALLIPSKGEINLQFNDDSFVISKNHKEKRLKQIRRHCGLVFQFPEHQLFEVNVLKDVMFGPLNFTRDDKLSEEWSKDALSKLGIDKSYYLRSPFDLSGGEKRKVAIAGILASRPQVLILDEPSASLDANSKEELVKLIREIKNQGKMIIVVSHDVDLAYELADKIVVLSNGKVISYKTPYDTFNDKEIVETANLETPFVYKISDALNIEDKNLRRIGDLATYLRGKANE